MLGKKGAWEGVLKVFGRCLEGIRKESGRGLEGAWKIFFNNVILLVDSVKLSFCHAQPGTKC